MGRAGQWSLRLPCAAQGRHASWGRRSSEGLDVNEVPSLWPELALSMKPEKVHEPFTGPLAQRLGKRECLAHFMGYPGRYQHFPSVSEGNQSIVKERVNVGGKEQAIARIQALARR